MSDVYTDDLGDDETGYKAPAIPDEITQEWLQNASPTEVMLAVQAGKVTGGGMYARPVEPTEKPLRPFAPADGPTITRDDLKRMSPEDVARAYTEGLLDDLL
ncbi:hypothetical protein ACTWJ8_30750 [Streptomyces sp. SDT5-1]|uniref:hypothetical protein n=1 Tax=Streptomyces sp. SDT5-1 TaxID=3406418 RepID=UPI003FD2DECE